MSRPPFVPIVALAMLGLLAAGAAGGWDLTRPVTEALPEPIGVEPEGDPEDPVPDAADPTFEDQLMELVNSERWANGQLAPLKRNDMLDASSGLHSANMAARNFTMHCDPDTLTMPWDRMVAAGYVYSAAAENIAWGYPDPAAVVAGWMGSAGHRANLLSTTYRELGNGYVNEPGDQGNIRQTTGTGCTPNVFNQGPFFRYWTQNFGKRSSVYPVVIEREAYLTASRDVALYLYGPFNEMRLRNDTGAWTDWMPFANDVAWELSPGNGVKTVYVETRGASTVYSASDTIILEGVTDVIFIDGFESGGTGGWSSVTP
jgi:uncharacterized protein YkwD